jgi:hypothetical protein
MERLATYFSHVKDPLREIGVYSVIKHEIAFGLKAFPCCHYTDSSTNSQRHHPTLCTHWALHSQSATLVLKIITYLSSIHFTLFYFSFFFSLFFSSFLKYVHSNSYSAIGCIPKAARPFTKSPAVGIRPLASFE